MLAWLKKLFSKKEEKKIIIDANEPEKKNVVPPIIETIIDSSVISECEAWLDLRFSRIELFFIKRFADPQQTVPLLLNICDFLKPMDSLWDSKCRSLEQLWNEDILYVWDNFKVNGIPDYWQLPVETQALKKGDCEDASSFRLAKADYMFGLQNGFECLGFFGNAPHAFPGLIDFKKEDLNSALTVLEATSNSHMPVLLGNSKYRVCYIFNKNNAWMVDGSVIFGKKVLDEFGIDTSSLKFKNTDNEGSEFSNEWRSRNL